MANFFWDKENHKLTIIDWNLLDDNTPEHRNRDIRAVSELLFRIAAGKQFIEEEDLEQQLGSVSDPKIQVVLRKA